MPEFFAIIGYPNCRKSSTVRALTGAWERRHLMIATQGGTFEFFVQITSLQEAHISAQTFITEMQNTNTRRILAPLWVDSLTVGATTYDNAQIYLRDFLAAGWTISGVAVLSMGVPYQLPAGCPNPNYVHNPTHLATNEIASRIRNWWGWL